MANNIFLKLKEKLLEDASKIKTCRNCAQCYMREDQEWGYCKLHHKGRPIEHPLAVNEYHTCKKWESKEITKKKEEEK